MTKVLISESTGPVLDWLVATAMKTPEIGFEADGRAIPYSTNGGLAWRLMDEENISVKPHKSPRDGLHFDAWKYNEDGSTGYYGQRGATKLVAAMRCFAYSKFDSDEVDVPDAILHLSNTDQVMNYASQQPSSTLFASTNLPEYTSAIGEAGQRYFQSFGQDFNVRTPGTFRFEELWNVMTAAAGAPHNELQDFRVVLTVEGGVAQYATSNVAGLQVVVHDVDDLCDGEGLSRELVDRMLDAVAQGCTQVQIDSSKEVLESQSSTAAKANVGSPETITVAFVSVWEEGEVETTARLNLRTGVVSHVGYSEVGIDYNHLRHEEIRLPGTDVMTIVVSAIEGNNYLLQDKSTLSLFVDAISAQVEKTIAKKSSHQRTDRGLEP